MKREFGFLVVWCGGSRRVGSMKAAYKLARSKGSRFFSKGGCSGATVLKTYTGGNAVRPDLGSGRVVLKCSQKSKDMTCRRIGQ